MREGLRYKKALDAIRAHCDATEDAIHQAKYDLQQKALEIAKLSEFHATQLGELKSIEQRFSTGSLCDDEKEILDKVYNEKYDEVGNLKQTK